MKKIFRTDMSSFFEMIKRIKDCIDFCNDDVSHLFKSFSSEPDDVECYVREDMWCLPFVTDFEWLYYDFEMNLPEEDRETWGEAWTFSNGNMVDYYKLLNELLKTNEISKVEFELHKSDMEEFIHENILDNQEYYGISYDFIYAEKEGEKDYIKVYLDYNSGFSQFILYCGIIQIFDRFKTKLKELQETYCNQEELLEAA